MNDTQKLQIQKLRVEGLGYGKIAEKLDISINTIKTYCKRHGFGGVAVEQTAVKGDEHFCLSCGVPVVQIAGRKRRGFALINVETNGGIQISIRLTARQIMNIFVFAVKSLLPCMVIRIVSIAAMNVI